MSPIISESTILHRLGLWGLVFRILLQLVFACSIRSLTARLGARACLGKAAGSKCSALVVRKSRYVDLYFARRSLDARPSAACIKSRLLFFRMAKRPQAGTPCLGSLDCAKFVWANYLSRIILGGANSTLVVFRRLNSNSFEPVSLMEKVLTQALCSKYVLS